MLSLTFSFVFTGTASLIDEEMAERRKEEVISNSIPITIVFPIYSLYLHRVKYELFFLIYILSVFFMIKAVYFTSHINFSVD